MSNSVPARTRFAGVGTAALLAVSLTAAPAWAGTVTVDDPVGDTQMMRGGPDIVSVKVDYGTKKVKAAVTYDSAEDIAYATNGGTITGINMRFKNGKEYTLQRHAADPAWQSPLVNEIIISGTARRVKCDGVKSKVATAAKRVTVSAPVSCFKGKGTKLKSQGFSFTVNYDVDETRWSKWVKQG